MRGALKKSFYTMVLVVPVLFAVVAIWQQRWMSDDGFINLRIVSNLLDGHGLRFNVSERVEAGTSTLWLVILAMLGAIGVRLEDAAIVAGCALMALGFLSAIGGSIWLLGGVRRAMERLAIPAGLLVMVALPPVWDYGTSGLEFGLTVAWIGSVWAWLGHHVYSALLDRERGWWHVCGGALLIGLGPLVRPDLAMVSFVFGMTWLVLTRSFWKRSALLRLAAIGVSAMALPVLYQLFRMGYYAALTPNTAFAKEAFDSRWTQGWHYVQHLTEPYALHVPVLLLVLSGVAHVLKAWRVRREVALMTCAALISAGLQFVYVVKVGGGFMHARLLLPAVWLAMLPALLVPLRRHVHARAPAHRARFVWSNVLTWVVCAVWAVVCASNLRVARENKHGIGDERGWYARIAGEENPYRIEHFREFGSRHFYKGAAKIVAQLEASCPVVGAPECERLLINDVPYSALKDMPDVVPMREGMYGEVRGVAARVPIGMSGFLMGPEVHLVDRAGLAGAISSRMILRRRGRPGHEKIMGDAWLYGRFAQPGQGDHQAVRDAREALGCGALLELQQAISEPLSWSQFWRNVAFSVRQRHLRIPPEPELAKFLFCGARERSLTPMLGAKSGTPGHFVCPESRAMLGLEVALHHEEESVAFLRPVCEEGGAQDVANFGKLSKEGDRGVFSFVCEEGETLRLRGRGETFVHALGIVCEGDAGRREEDVVGYSRGALREVGCGPEERVVGIQVQSGSLIDAVGLICEAR